MDNHLVQHTWHLGDEPDAVPSARRLASKALLEESWPTSVISDVEMVVTELTSNALMHAGAPVELRVGQGGTGVRVEVQDNSPVAPVRPLAGTDAMTGRGLALVSAVAHRWGVHPVSGGKVVWAELALPGGPDDQDDAGQDVDELLAAWPDHGEGDGSARVKVTLGDVPTELLLAAKAHVDNVLREFTLAEAGAVSGSTARVTPDLARLIRTVTTRFAEARRSIKQQALQAVASGQERTRLVLSLPVTSADAGRDYLAALDEVDAYARAARLLTLESAPEHRAFRRWYVTALVDQLGAVGRGEHPPNPPSFERFLLDELGAIASAKASADRSARLQAVTASLAGATSLDDVAGVVVSQGVAALGASGGGLLVPVGDRLSIPGAVGYEDELVEQIRSERRDARLPAAVAMATGEAVWLESREDRDAEFPELTGLEPTTVSMCAVPLRVEDRVLGALRFSFDSPRLFDEDERTFVEALAAQTAVAVDRSQLRGAEQDARHAAETVAVRLARLHRVTAALAGASTYEEVGAAVVAQAAGTLGADLSALSILEGESLRLLDLGGGEPGSRERWATFPLSGGPAGERGGAHQRSRGRGGTVQPWSEVPRPARRRPGRRAERQRAGHGGRPSDRRALAEVPDRARGRPGRAGHARHDRPAVRRRAGASAAVHRRTLGAGTVHLPGRGGRAARLLARPGGDAAQHDRRPGASVRRLGRGLPEERAEQVRRRDDRAPGSCRDPGDAPAASATVRAGPHGCRRHRRRGPDRPEPAVHDDRTWRCAGRPRRGPDGPGRRPGSRRARARRRALRTPSTRSL